MGGQAARASILRPRRGRRLLVLLGYSVHTAAGTPALWQPRVGPAPGYRDNLPDAAWLEDGAQEISPERGMLRRSANGHNAAEAAALFATPVWPSDYNPTYLNKAMSDWDFLHDMHNSGYSADEIADAAGCGYAPWDEKYIDREWFDSQLKDVVGDRSIPKEKRPHFESRDGFPFCTTKQIEIFEDLLDCASRHFANTGRYLQIWGELGEIYAEIKFGLRRHGTHAEGSDGSIQGKLVEVKTISPEKSSDSVLVKRAGNFEQLLIVRIDQNFEFKGKLIERAELQGSSGKYLRGQLRNA